MSIHCPACGFQITVPPERATNPNLKVKCRCGHIFVLSAAKAVTSATPAASVSAMPVPMAFAAGPARPAAAAAPAVAASSIPTPGPAAPRFVEAARPAAPPLPAATTEPDPNAPPRPRSPRPGSWRRCLTHAQTASESVCRTCGVGYCVECEKKVQNATICPTCDSLCVKTKDHEEGLARDRQRARPLTDDIPTIMGYPLRDPIAFVMLALFTWFFGLIAHVVGLAHLLSQGVLMSYSFYALSRVAVGNLRDFMPDFRDIGDLARPMRLGLAAFLASTLPLLVVSIALPGISLMADGRGRAELAVVHAQPPPSLGVAGADEGEQGDQEEEKSVHLAGGRLARGTPAVFVLLLGLALVWKVVYTPVALTVAGLSRSFLSTLNPVIGVGTIRRMGAVYWQALGIYTVLAVAQWVLGLVLSLIPILGGLVKSFVDAYAYLAIGCTLGLAVFKKAKELGWD